MIWFGFLSSTHVELNDIIFSQSTFWKSKRKKEEENRQKNVRRLRRSCDDQDGKKTRSVVYFFANHKKCSLDNN